MGTFKRKLLIFAQKNWEKDEFLHVFACAAGFEGNGFCHIVWFFIQFWEKGHFSPIGIGQKEKRLRKK